MTTTGTYVLTAEGIHYEADGECECTTPAIAGQREIPLICATCAKHVTGCYR